MAVREARLLLMALLDGLADEAALTSLVGYLRDGTTPTAAGSGTIRVATADVLVKRGDVGAVAGQLGLGTAVSCWRQVGAWWFVSTADVAGWVHEDWVTVV